MSVHKTKRKDGRPAWVVRWRDGIGNRQRTFGTRRDADLWDNEVRRRRQLGTLAQLDAGAETLDAYVAGTWLTAHAVDLAEKTQRSYACLYDRHISPALGHVPLREINTDAIAAWRGHMLKADTSRDVIHRAMKLLGSILQRAAEGGRIPHNPARLVAKPKREAKNEVRPLAQRPSRRSATRSCIHHRARCRRRSPGSGSEQRTRSRRAIRGTVRPTRRSSVCSHTPGFARMKRAL